jgi:hypothetical protein
MSDEPIFSVLSGKTTGYTVSDAGEVDVNGTYCEAGIYEGRAYYTYQSPELGTLYISYTTSLETWLLRYELDNDTEAYYSTGLIGGSVPPLSGWESSFWGIEIGNGPEPTLTSTTC